jgi:serine protease Do
MKESPAEKAGIKQGDVILQYNGKIVEDTGHLRNMVSQTAVGTTIKVRLLRQKKEIETEVVIAELPKKMAEAGLGSGEEPAAGEENTSLAGVSVRELTPELAKQLGVSDVEKGVVAVKVDPGSRMHEAGIRPGDVILQINQKNIGSMEDYRKAASTVREKERVLLLIHRKGSDLFVTVKPQ